MARAGGEARFLAFGRCGRAAPRAPARLPSPSVRRPVHSSNIAATAPSDVVFWRHAVPWARRMAFLNMPSDPFARLPWFGRRLLAMAARFSQIFPSR